MAIIERFEDIEAWKRAREITKKIYEFSSAGEFSKDFGLKDQMRRCSVSIMSNIAEGFERDGNKEFANFLSIAKASCGEAKSQLYVARDQNYISNAQFDWAYTHLEETDRIIGGLMNYLKQSELRGRKFR